jgi:hypothetical protein
MTSRSEIEEWVEAHPMLSIGNLQHSIHDVCETHTVQSKFEPFLSNLLSLSLAIKRFNKGKLLDK